MERRSFLKNTGLTIAAFTLLKNSALASFLNDPAFKVKMLTNKIGIFTEKGGTILFMLGKKDVVVVDSQFPDSAKNCIEEIKKLSNRKFTYLINTHHHSDHTAGNIVFKGLVKEIVAHKNSMINQEAATRKNTKASEQFYPSMIYDTTWSRKIKGERITINYFGSGHTNGDSFVHFENANIVHVGDMVFNRRFPYIDKTAGANIESWIKALTEATSKYNDTTTYVCGHSGTGYDVVLTKNDVLAFRDYLSNLLKLGKEKIDAGISKEEFMKLKEVPGSPEWKGDGISRSLDAVWQELKK